MARIQCHRCPGRGAGRSRDRHDAPALPRPHALRRSWRMRRFGSRIRQARACFRAETNCAVARANRRGSGTPRSSCWCGNRSCRGRRHARWLELAVPVQTAAMEVSIAYSPLCAFQLQSVSRFGVLSFVGRISEASCAVTGRQFMVPRRRRMTLRLCPYDLVRTTLHSMGTDVRAGWSLAYIVSLPRPASASKDAPGRIL